MNEDMGYDPRAVSNAILDIADTLHVSVTNLALNKILFFAHADWLDTFKRRLSSLAFEAWQYGPVVPLIYHQFKHHGNQTIDSRASMLDLDTGGDITVPYDSLNLDLDHLHKIVSQYGHYSPSTLVQLSHIEGGAWDIVWNSSPRQNFGMVIPDSLISETIRSRTPRRQIKPDVH